MIICQDVVHSVEAEHTGANDSAGETGISLHISGVPGGSAD